MLQEYLQQYGLIAIFGVVAFVAPLSLMLLSWLFFRLGLRPRQPGEVKGQPYECGVQSIGGQWNQFNFHYYAYAILFVIFDVTVVFLYPWASKFLRLGLFALIEAAVFVGILMVGLAYAWRKRDLEWR